MRYQTAIALGILAATCGSAAAAPRYVGMAVMDTVTAACGTAAKPGFFASMRFRPAAVGDNGPNTTIDFFNESQAVALVIKNAKLDGTVRPADGTLIISSPVSFAATLKASPAPNPTTTTNYLNFVATVGNYVVPACNVTFKVGLVRLPN